MKRIWSIVLLSILLVLPALACGSSAVPVEPTSPTGSPNQAPTSTPSAGNHVEQGNAYKEAGNVEGAIAEFQRALELEPDNAEAHANLGLIFIDQGRFAEAVPEFEAALTVDPKNDSAIGGLCVANAFVEPEQAVAQCRAALEDHPENADLHNGLGVALVNQKQFNEAMSAFKDAIQLKPDHIWAHNNLGYLYLQIGRLDEAVVELNEAIRINPKNAQAYYNLGLTYATQKDYNQAIPKYEEALRLDPTMAAAYYDLGVIYRIMGQTEEAVTAFEKFLELKPDSSERATIETEIALMQPPVDLPPGTYIEFDDALDYNSDNDADFFSFFTSPSDLFGNSKNTVTITVRPESGLDVSITVLDSSTGANVVVADVDKAGLGGEEYITVTLPKAVSTMGVYTISIIANQGSGAYHALLGGSPAVGFSISDGWKVLGVLGDRVALFVTISALGKKAGQAITFEAIPRPEDNLDLTITAIDTSGNKNLGTLNETGMGEAESDTFVPGSSVYLFIVGDQKGHPGQLIINCYQ
jgi:superkiller protein 3